MSPGNDGRAAAAAALATLLAAATVAPLIRGGGWFVVVGLVVVAVMLAGIVARHRARTWMTVAALQLIVLGATLGVLFGRSQLLDPAGLPALFRNLLDGGLTVTREQAPPVDAVPGVVLMLAAGLGAVAVAVDLLAVTLRQPAVAGLPLLAVYCVPAALLPAGLPWHFFVLAAAGFVALLATDAGDRARGWGRVLTSTRGGDGTPRSSMEGPAGLARGGRRLAALVVVVAAAAPALVPGLGDRLLTGGSGGSGGSGTTSLNPILDLRRNLTENGTTELIRYVTSGKDPEPLRVLTSDTFDGAVWAPSEPNPSGGRVQAGLPLPPGLADDVPVTPVNSQISVRGLRERYLPLPYPARLVEVEGRWTYDAATLNVVARDGSTTQDLSYRVTSLDVQPTAAQLNAAPAAEPQTWEQYLQLPEDLPAEVRTTAEETAGEGTDYQKAVRLQRWFRGTGGFQYSTDAPEGTGGQSDSGTTAMVAFLRERRGYCVHFASAMTVMARHLGIPARIGIGFLPGGNRGDGSRVITGSDAHAWPELFFDGVGWVRFEPTPRGNLTTPPTWTVPSEGIMPEDDAAAPTPSASAAPEAPPTPDAAPVPEALPDDVATGSAVTLPWRPLLVALLVGLLLAAPWLSGRAVRSLLWRRATSGADRAEAAWEELRLGLGDLGIRWVDSWTPRATAHRLATDHDLDDEARAALQRLVADLEAARYAPPGHGPARRAAAARADVAVVLAAVGAVRPALVRQRARWVPWSGPAAVLRVLGGARAGRATAGSAGERAPGPDLGTRLRDRIARSRDRSGTSSRSHR